MSERIIRSATSTRLKLDRLLERAKQHKMTPQEIWDQRVSFAHGNQRLSGEEIPRQRFVEAAIKIYGPRPTE